LTTWSLHPDGVAGVRLAGELDLATVSALDAVVSECLAHRPAAVDIDVAALTFCDDIGVHGFSRARRAAAEAGAGFGLSRPRPQLLRALTAMQSADLLAPGFTVDPICHQTSSNTKI
jgi:anti-anti-sigma factor